MDIFLLLPSCGWCVNSFYLKPFVMSYFWPLVWRCGFGVLGQASETQKGQKREAISKEKQQPMRVGQKVKRRVEDMLKFPAGGFGGGNSMIGAPDDGVN